MVETGAQSAHFDGPLTMGRLRELLSYDPLTGIFTWRTGRPGASTGSIAGSLGGGHGYLVITVDRKKYLAHRLAWFYTHGEWPAFDLDHKNTRRADNRIDNLREAVAPALNQQNQRKPHRDNKLGVQGVCLVRGKFRATIGIDNRSTFIGNFDTIEEAHQAYVERKRKIHGGCTL